MTCKELEEKQAYILFIAIGVGYLFPFSALTQPVDYWNELFPDFNVEYTITNVYMWVNLLFIGALVILGGEPVYKRRIFVGFLGQLLILVIVPTSWFFHFNESVNYWVVVSCTTIAAIVTALIDSCAISFSAQFPESIQAGFQVGIGMSTLIGSVYRIFTKLVFRADKVVSSSLLYFYCGAGTIAFCMLCFKWLLAMDISKNAIRFGLSPYSRNQLENRDRKEFKISHELDILLPSTDLALKPFSTNYQTVSAVEDGRRSDGFKTPSKVLTDEELFSMAAKCKILMRILPALGVVFVVFFTTLALWPALVTEIPSYNFHYLQETSWWSLLLLFNFAVTDCLGRTLVVYRGILTKDNIWIFAALRLLCVPALVCCSKGWVFTNDLWTVFFVAILGYTNGYLGSLSIIMVNEWIDEEFKGLAGTFTGFALNAGLVVGATAAVFVENAVKNL